MSRNHLRFCGPLVGLVLLLQSGVPAEAQLATILSPHRSLSRTRQLLDAADVRVLMPLGYQRVTDAADAALARRAGVAESRVYLKGGSPARLELAILEGVTGGYELALYAAPRSPAAADLSRIEAQIRAIVETHTRILDAGKDEMIALDADYDKVKLLKQRNSAGPGV